MGKTFKEAFAILIYKFAMKFYKKIKFEKRYF